MLDYLFDIIFIVIAAVTAFLIARKGLVHAASFFFATLVASLFTIATFEWISVSVDSVFLLPADVTVRAYLSFSVCVIVFTAMFAFLAWCIVSILPVAPEMSDKFEFAGQWLFGVLTGYLFAAFVLTVSLTFPASRDFGGAFPAEAHRRKSPIMATAPDYQMLALVEYTCEHNFPFRGGPWSLDRPLLSVSRRHGRWASFPARYAMWREACQYVWFSEP